MKIKLGQQIEDYKVIDYDSINKKYTVECIYCNIQKKYAEASLKDILKNHRRCECVKSNIKINDVFGKLTVLKRDITTQKKGLYWICQCECGNKTSVYSTSLKNGNTKSCGCLAKETGLNKWNIEQSEKAKIPIGTKFGKLTVIEDLGFREQIKGHRRRWYKCKCDCGNIHDVQGNLLKQGLTISCGQCLSSKGEYLIQQILNDNNIIYNYNCSLPEFVKETGRQLRFDFIIYNDKGEISRIIEFDGRQHFYGPDTEYWSRTKDTLEDIKERDKIKNNWCLSHNIPLIRIPYYYLDLTLTDLLGDKFIFKGE